MARDMQRGACEISSDNLLFCYIINQQRVVESWLEPPVVRRENIKSSLPADVSQLLVCGREADTYKNTCLHFNSVTANSNNRMPRPGSILSRLNKIVHSRLHTKIHYYRNQV